MTQTIKIRNEPAQHIGVANSAPCPEMNIITKEITENGRYEARTEGVTGFDPVIVNVPSREEIGYENGYAAGYGKGSTDGYADALAKRTELEVTANGEYIPDSESTGFSKVSVNLPSDTDTVDGLISGTLSGAYRNDRVTTIRNYAIYMMNVTSVDMPNVTSVGERAVYACKQLTSVNMPLVETIGTMAFYADTVLVEIDFPRLKSVPQRAFADCLGLMTANLPSVTSIGTSAFNNSGLNALILRSNTVCTLSNTNAFTATGISRGTGFVYVPDDLVEQYKVATNWSTYASQIKPISELEE